VDGAVDVTRARAVALLQLRDPLLGFLQLQQQQQQQQQLQHQVDRIGSVPNEAIPMQEWSINGMGGA